MIHKRARYGVALTQMLFDVERAYTSWFQSLTSHKQL